MDEYFQIEHEDDKNRLKKRARAAVNVIAFASLLSTAIVYVFYTVISLLSPVFSRFLENAIMSLGHSRVYAAVFTESFMNSEEISWFISCIEPVLCSFVPFAVLSKAVFGMKAEEAAPINGKIMGSFPFVYCAALIMASAVSSVAGTLFSFLLPDAYGDSVIEMTEIYGTSVGTASLILSFLSMCVVAPLAEEFIFRGVMFGYLKKFGVHFAAFSSALIFALGHATVDQIAYAFVFGLVLCMVTERTGNLKTAIIIHFINNFLGYFRTYILPVVATEEIEVIIEAVYGAIVGVFAIIGMIMFFVKRHKKQPEYDEQAEKNTENAPVSCFFGIGTAFVIFHSIFNVIMGLMLNG